MMTLLNPFIFGPNVLLQKNTVSGEKKEAEEGNLRIDYDKSSHPEGFFFSLRQKQESVSSFFFFFLLPSYTLYNIPQLYLSEGAANSLKKIHLWLLISQRLSLP